MTTQSPESEGRKSTCMSCGAWSDEPCPRRPCEYVPHRTTTPAPTPVAESKERELLTELHPTDYIAALQRENAKQKTMIFQLEDESRAFEKMMERERERAKRAEAALADWKSRAERVIKERDELGRQISELQNALFLSRGAHDISEAELAAKTAECERSNKFIENAFLAHPNLDLDIAAISAGKPNGT